MERLEEVPGMVFQDRIQRRTAEQIFTPVFKVFLPGQGSTAFCGAEHQKSPVDESISQIMEERVEVVKTVFQKRISERIFEQGGVVEVSKISSQHRVLQRTVEQTLDESCVPRTRGNNELPSKLMILPKSWAHC